MTKTRRGSDGGGGKPPTVTADGTLLAEPLIVDDPVCWLWVQSQGPGLPEQMIPLPLVGEFTLGREGDVVIDGPTISRVHAVATRFGQGLRIRLPASAPKNGVEVRAVRLDRDRESAVAPGEPWRMGTTVVVAITDYQARGQRALASLLGTDATTAVVSSAARGGSFSVVGEDAAACRAVALAIADVSPRRTGRRGTIMHGDGGANRPRDRETVRAFAESVSAGLAIVEQDAVAALGLSVDDRTALERYLTDGARGIQFIWCGRLGIGTGRYDWVYVPTLADRAKAGDLPGLFAHALSNRGARVSVHDLFARSGLRMSTLTLYEWPDGRAEFELCVEYLLDRYAGVPMQETARKAGLTRYAMRRIVQAWENGSGTRRRGLFDRLLPRGGS